MSTDAATPPPEGILRFPVQEVLREPNEQVVKILTSLLEEAKSGDLQGLVCITDNGPYLNQTIQGNFEALRMLGALDLVSLQLRARTLSEA